MSTPSADAFLMAPTIPRDRWKRPLIGDPHTGQLVPYTRASTFANMIEDNHGIALWKLRHLALGLGAHEDLAGMLAGLTYEQHKDRVDEIVDLALDRQGTHAKANYGTAVHRLTEPGCDVAGPQRMRADVAAYETMLESHRIDVLATEQFVVCDELQVAGTFDHLYRLPGERIVVADKKTGRLHPNSVAVQLAVYAHGQLYDPDTGRRTPIHPQLNQTIGLAVHLPAGEGRCDVHGVDLAAGWAAARLAVKVRAWRARQDLTSLLASTIPSRNTASKEHSA